MQGIQTQCLEGQVVNINEWSGSATKQQGTEGIMANLKKKAKNFHKKDKNYLVPDNTALKEWESSIAISYFLSNAEHPDKQVKFTKFWYNVHYKQTTTNILITVHGNANLQPLL